ncbi:MAG: MFS transporter [Planctomycetota bacterium]
MLALYAALRGVAVAAFLPWWRGIVQAEVRGRFLAGESLSNSAAAIIAFSGVTAYLSIWHGPTAYAILFLLSFFAGIGGLYYLRKIPDAPAEVEPDNPTQVPWRAILSHRPFVGLLGFFALFNIAMAGASVCWVTLLRDHFTATDVQMSSLPAMGAVAMGLTLLLVARMLDKVGSRPVIAVGVGLWSLHLMTWGALAGGLLPFGYPTLILIQALSGTGAALVAAASTRLLMATVPGQGRTHFFAVYGFTQALALGLLPACWGIAIDMSHRWTSAIGPIALNSWSVIYPILAVIMAASLVPLATVPEPKAMSTRDFLTELLVNTPGRALTRLTGRDR